MMIIEQFQFRFLTIIFLKQYHHDFYSSVIIFAQFILKLSRISIKIYIFHDILILINFDPSKIIKYPMEQ